MNLHLFIPILVLSYFDAIWLPQVHNPLQSYLLYFKNTNSLFHKTGELDTAPNLLLPARKYHGMSSQISLRASKIPLLNGKLQLLDTLFKLQMTHKHSFCMMYECWKYDNFRRSYSFVTTCTQGFTLQQLRVCVQRLVWGLCSSQGSIAVLVYN